MALYAYNRDSGIQRTISSRTVSTAYFYDTRLDTDGGAWRMNTQDTTWYKEAASSTRGSRKEFPVVALITVENFTTHWGVVIYDADDPSFPMWMQILGGPDMTSETILRGTTVRDAKMKNGFLVVPTADTTAFIDFITEEHRLGHDDAWYWFPDRQGLYDRNRQIGEPSINITGSTSGPGLINGGIGANNNHYVDLELPAPGTYDVSKLAHRNGLPFPQALITSTGYGTTYVQFDGDMDLPLAIGNSHGYPSSLRNYFMSPSEAVAIHNGPSSGQSLDVYDPRRMVTAYHHGAAAISTPDHGWQNSLSAYPKVRSYAFGGGSITKGQEVPIQAISFGGNGDYNFNSTTNKFIYNKKGDFIVAAGVGVTHAIKENKDDPRNGLACSTRSFGTTGWMCGDTVIAMDAQTADDVNSTDLISNGYDPTTSNNWAISNTGSLSFASSDFDLTSTSFAGIYQTGITVVPGTSYLISLAWADVNGTYSDIDIRIKDNSLGTTYQTITRSGSGGMSGVFTAPAGVTSVAIQIIPGRGGVGSGRARINRIRMTESYLTDFGPYQHNMHATGTFSRGQVPGSDICYFHNFGAGSQTNSVTASQLVIPAHNTYMDANNTTGKGVCLMAWVYAPANVDGYEGIMGLGNSDGSEQFNLGVGTSYTVYFDYGGGGEYISLGSSDFQIGRWVFVVAYVSPRQLGTVMIDGKHVDAYNSNTGYSVRNRMGRDDFMSNYDYMFTIGNVRGGHLDTIRASSIRIALPRMSYSIPSDEQVKFIYEQERVWFQGGGGASGYPTSQNVYHEGNLTNIAYDMHRNEQLLTSSQGTTVRKGSTTIEKINSDAYDVAAIHDGKTVFGT